MLTAGGYLTFPPNTFETFATVPFSASGNITVVGKWIASLPTFCFNMLPRVCSWFLNWKEVDRERVTHALRPLCGELEDV
jgi:hypothetical protein